MKRNVCSYLLLEYANAHLNLASALQTGTADRQYNNELMRIFIKNLPTNANPTVDTTEVNSYNLLMYVLITYFQLQIP